MLSSTHKADSSKALCPNKTIKHKIYSHKKPHNGRSTPLCVFYITPQGTQSVELRSTSQRIIKDVLTKTPLTPFASLACSAVKLTLTGGTYDKV